MMLASGMNVHRFFKRFGQAAIFLALTACSAPQATIQWGGSLNVLSNTSPYDADNLPDDWVLSGTTHSHSITAAKSLGSQTLSVISAPTAFSLVRRVEANLLATPYLSWRWRLSPGEWQYHPVRIVVGFAGGGSEPIPQSTFGKLFPGTTFPSHDRTLIFLWAPSALMRGTLTQMETKSSFRRQAEYVVRGGAENVERWWQETVDLAALYKRSWPTDQAHLARIRFVGIASAPSASALTTFLSDIRLSR